MLSENLIQKSLLIYIILFIAVISFSAENRTAKESDAILKILNDRTNGNDPFYMKALSPAQSLETDRSKADRVQSVNSKISAEINKILLAFKNADETKKVEAVSQAASTIEDNLVKNNGAYITFYDQNPSAAISRTLLMVPKKVKIGLTSNDLFSILTSYKHSAKSSDFLYEYPSAQNLTQGEILSNQGTETSWKGHEAGKPFVVGTDVVLKKCRQLLGWRCVTSLYHVDSLLKTTDQIKILFIAIYDLTSNPDHANFANDKRSNNQITGSTAIYFVKESKDWLLLYGVDAQWNDGKLSFQGAIQTEFKKDFARFKERVALDLNTSVDQLK